VISTIISLGWEIFFYKTSGRDICSKFFGWFKILWMVQNSLDGSKFFGWFKMPERKFYNLID